MKDKKRIALHIQSEVQFYSLEPLLKELKNSSYDVTILIERHDEDSEGWQEMSKGTVDLMKAHGFEPKYTEDFVKEKFDLCLTPYMDGLIKADCYLKYDYGSLNTKPSLTYIPAALEGFHGFLCTGSDGLNLMSVYGKTFPVDNLRFLGKKRKANKNKKKIVLFAPTYNDEYDINENAEIIKKLKKDYYVILKSHHGTNYLKKNEAKKTKMKDAEPDEYYGSEVNLIDLMMRADVCLSGNSSTIGDAIRAGVPCVVYAHDLDCFKWGNIHTTQYDLNKEGSLLACKKVDQIEGVLQKAMTKEYLEKWEKLAKKMFPKEFHTGVKGYLEVIDYFLNDPQAKKYVIMHDYYVNGVKNNNEQKDKEIRIRDKELNRLRNETSAQRSLLDDFEKRRLYQVADRLYGLKRRFLRIRR